MGGGCSKNNTVAVEAYCPSYWVEMHDDSGNAYWYNMDNGNYTYEKQRVDWRHIDDGENNWWYNEITGETRWDYPLAFGPIADTSLTDMLTEIRDCLPRAPMAAVPLPPIQQRNAPPPLAVAVPPAST